MVIGAGKGDLVPTTVVLFDLHYPKVHWTTFRLMLQFIKANKVDEFIFGGDQFDNECISHHTKGKPYYRPRAAYVRDEAGFDAGVLSVLDAALRRAKKHWLVGNHDFWEFQLVEENPELEGLIDRPTSLRLAKRGWNVVPLGKSVQVGKLRVIHGETLTGIGNQGGMYPARKAVEMYGCNVLAGHTHSPQSYTRVSPIDQTQKRMGWIAPIGGRTNPGYLRNKPNAWVNGFVVIETGAGGNFNLTPINIMCDWFRYGGKEYRI